MKYVKIGLILLLAALIIMIVIKSFAWTPAIRDSGGRRRAASIAALEKVRIGGLDQWILIRGNDTANPVLLWLHGGPGAAQMPVARYFNGPLEKEFIVVHWDQRGAGKSNPRNFDERTMSLAQFVSDAHELTRYLKKRLHKSQIYLVGHSWGTILGVELARLYPEDYYAYIGTGQFVNMGEANRIAYNWLLKLVKGKADSRELNRLRKLGAPPYVNHEQYVAFAKMVEAYGGGLNLGTGQMAWIALQAPEYCLGDYLAWLNGANRGSGPMWQPLLAFDARRVGPRLSVPVYFFNGRNDYNTPLPLVADYFESLSDPQGKRLVIFENSAHAPFMSEPQKFNRELTRVKAETYR